MHKKDKGDDPNKQLENIRRTGENKQCFDCGGKVGIFLKSNNFFLGYYIRSY